MNNELERIWKEDVVAQFKILAQHLPGRTKKSHKRTQSGMLVSGQRFEPWDFLKNKQYCQPLGLDVGLYSRS
jgi:hypothetical protein